MVASGYGDRSSLELFFRILGPDQLKQRLSQHYILHLAQKSLTLGAPPSRDQALNHLIRAACCPRTQSAHLPIHVYFRAAGLDFPEYL